MVQDRRPFLVGACGNQLFDRPIERVAVLYPVRIAPEARILDPFGTAERTRQRGEQLVIAGGDHNQSVARRIAAIGRDHGHTGALPLRQLARGLIIRGMVAHPAERGFKQRGIDGHPIPAFAALEKCGEHADHGPHAGRHVHDRGPHAHRLLVRFPCHAHQSAKGLHQGVVAWTILERPHGSKRTDGAVDERRFEFSQRVRIESEFRGRSRPQVLNDHIGALENELA